MPSQPTRERESVCSCLIGFIIDSDVHAEPWWYGTVSGMGNGFVRVRLQKCYFTAYIRIESSQSNYNVTQWK